MASGISGPTSQGSATLKNFGVPQGGSRGGILAPSYSYKFLADLQSVETKLHDSDGFSTHITNVSIDHVRQIIDIHLFDSVDGSVARHFEILYRSDPITWVMTLKPLVSDQTNVGHVKRFEDLRVIEHTNSFAYDDAGCSVHKLSIEFGKFTVE